MDGGDGPRKLTQRRFELAPAEATASPAPSELPEPEPSPAPSLPPLAPRPPSDIALRERQERWLEERSRFEASQKPRAPAAGAAK